MAEILAVTASAAGIASLGIQLLDGVSRLKDLYSNIKEAPREITALLDELSILVQILKSICERRASSSISDPGWDSCYQSCLSTIKVLDGTATDLQSYLNKNKFIGGFKVVLRQQMIVKQIEKLGRAKSTLLLAQQASMLTLLQSHHESVLARIESNQALLLQNIASNIESHNLTSSLPPGTKTYSNNQTDVVTRPKRPKHKSQSTRTYRLSSWWLKKVIEIERDCSSNSLSFSLRWHAIVPRGSEVLACARRGDLNRLVEMLRNNEASLWDQDIFGATLLHYAAEGGNFRMCQFLIQQGLDVNAGAGNLYILRPFDNWVVFARTDSRCDENYLHSMLRALAVENGADDILQPHHLEYSYLEAKLPLIALIKQHIWEYPDEESRVGAFNAALATREVDAMYFWSRLGSQSISDKEMVSIMDGYHRLWDLWFHLAAVFESCAYYVDDPTMDSWKDVVRFLHCFDTTLKTTKPQRSPLQKILRNWNFAFGNEYSVRRHEKLRVQRWVQWLGDAGVNIAKYGEVEAEYMREYPEFTSYSYNRPCRDMTYRIIKLCYGPSVSDWDIWLSHDLDERGHEFWNWIENPELFMPGSWPGEANIESNYFWDARWNRYLGSRRRRKRLRRYMSLPPDYDFDDCWAEMLVYHGWMTCDCLNEDKMILYCPMHMVQSLRQYGSKFCSYL